MALIMFPGGALAAGEVTLIVSPSSAADDLAPRADQAMYKTFKGALDAAQNGDTIAIAEDISIAAAEVEIVKDITLIAQGGDHTATLATAALKVQNGNNLIFGNGSGDVLTLTSANSPVASITNGYVEVNEGAKLVSTGLRTKTLTLDSANATGKITGGGIESISTGGAAEDATDKIALSMTNGAKISEISGGEFVARGSCIYMYDSGTTIDLISGGTFESVNDTTNLRPNISVDGSSQILEISGGTFEAPNTVGCLHLIRGGHVGKISGGSFICKEEYPRTATFRGRAISIESAGSPTGISEISGGTFSGEIGLMVVGSGGSTATVNRITGGTFSGYKAALQVDQGASTVGTINDATFTSNNQAIFNAGTIEEIGSGTVATGVYSAISNWATSMTSAGKIDLISGGTFTGSRYNASAVANQGTITKISGGVFIGSAYAVNMASLNNTPSLLGTISAGVFQGGSGVAINLKNPVILEPGLSSVKGVGRYWGNAGEIFNDEDLVIYPEDYYMSTRTEPVSGIASSEFKYLTKTLYIHYHPNGGSGTIQSASGEHGDKIQLENNGFINDPHEFIEWNTTQMGNGTSYSEMDMHTLTETITLYAQWQPPDDEPFMPEPETIHVYVGGSNSVPKTGDGTMVGVYWAVLGVSGFTGLAYVTLLAEKRKRKASK